ncbi:putative dCTP pyrophosphatase [Morganella phage vB_MmoM_Rgz1]|nr:putative dCTP pyrophosphatase [Morganella phage vB_MmoM_Rgz1]
MAHFNECSTLVNQEDVKKAQTLYNMLLSMGKNPLQSMMDMQESLQEYLAANKPETNRSPSDLKTCGDLLTWMRNQDDYIADETRELYTSLGGMSNGEKDASAVWKPWKARHEEMFNKDFDDLSPEDQLEVKFEMIDQVHFFMNKLIALGLDAEEIFVLYYLKNAENFNRQKRGY